MLIVMKNHEFAGRFESWTDLLARWGQTRDLGHGPSAAHFQVRKGVQGRQLVAGSKAAVIAHARDWAEQESLTNYYKAEGGRRQTRGRAYQPGTKAFHALFA